MGYPAQTYAQHINGVLDRIRCYSSDIARYSVSDGALLTSTAKIAAVYHDLGKLDGTNQAVLSGKKEATSLPINHTDAGTAFLLTYEHINLLAAVVSCVTPYRPARISSAKASGEDSMFRDDSVKAVVDASLSEYSQTHCGIINMQPITSNSTPSGNLSVFLRLLLSCLVDADHTDTATNYGNYPTSESHIALRAAERLAALDAYIAGKGSSGSERNKLRAEMYKACRNADINKNIAACDAPVGSGKTTAVMAHLLAQAQKRGLRRIFVILPFTNIIQQAVKVYRNSLVLPGENPEDVVSELHHRADFES